MTSSNKVVYVPLIRITPKAAELIDSIGTRQQVVGPGTFFVVGDQGKMCCVGLVLEEYQSDFLVRFQSGEQYWVNIPNPVFPPEYNSPEIKSAA